MYRRVLIGILVLMVSTGTVRSAGICDNPMLSTNKNNGTITVSSLLLDPNVVATPDRAILNTKELDLGQGHYDAGGWVSGIQDTNQYLQVDLMRPSVITGLVTQGRNGCCKQWVTEYNVSYSQDCKTWIKLDKTFSGNTDQDTAVTNMLTCPISAKCVRFIPLKWNDKISMRVDVHGCPILPISTIPLTSLPFSSATLSSPISTALSNISSTTAMTQTTNGLTSTTFESSPSTRLTTTFISSPTTRHTTTTFVSSPTTTLMFGTASNSTGLTTTQSCTDASGIDCQLLDSQVNICANSLASSKYCAKYCGICGLTTSTSLPQASAALTSGKSSTFSLPTTSLMSSEASTISSTTTTFSTTSSTSVSPSSSIQAITGATQPSSTSPNTPTPSQTPIYQTTSPSLPSTTISKCKDNPSINCSILNSTVALCGNFLTAQMYCPKFCNVCGINITFTQSPSTMKLSTQSSTTSMQPSYTMTGSVCQDKRGVDCDMLQRFLNVCQNPNTATLYCSRYCGICLKTTTALQLNTTGNGLNSTMPYFVKLSTLQNNTTGSALSTSHTPGGQPSGTSILLTSLSASTTAPLTTSTPSASTSAVLMLTTTSCSDKSGIDCKMLNNYLGICNDQTSASMYCPLFCGVCGQTANPSQNPFSKFQSGPASSSTQSKMTTGKTSMIHSQTSTATSSKSTAYMTTTSTGVAFTTPGSAMNATKISTTIPHSTVTMSQVCTDKQGIDCHQLDVYLNVCSDPKSAQLYCPRHCGVCGTTFSVRSQSTVGSSTVSRPNASTLSTGSTTGIPSSQAVLSTTFLQPRMSSSLSSQASSTPMTVVNSASQQSSTISSLNKTLTSSFPFSSNTPSSSASVSMSSSATMQHIPSTTNIPSSNSLLVSSLSFSSCLDKQGVDCHLLDTSLNICKDPVTSLAYCRKYCGLCGITSSTINIASASSTIYNYPNSSTTSISGQGPSFITAPTTQSSVPSSSSRIVSSLPSSQSSTYSSSPTYSIGNVTNTILTTSGMSSGQSSANLTISLQTGNSSAQTTVFNTPSKPTTASSSMLTASVHSLQQYSASGSPTVMSTSITGQSSSTIFNTGTPHSPSSSLLQTTNVASASGYFSQQNYSNSGLTSIPSKQPTTTLGSVTKQPSTTYSTTHDPCKDTLDCHLLDQFWGVCRNITIASGCLTYCGFCPSGVPFSLGSTFSHVSTALTGSQISQSPANTQQSTATNLASTFTPSSKASTVQVSQTTFTKGLSYPSSLSSSSGTNTFYTSSVQRNTMTSQNTLSKHYSSTQSGNSATGSANPLTNSSVKHSNSLSTVVASTTSGPSVSINSTTPVVSTPSSQASASFSGANTNSFSLTTALTPNGITLSQTFASASYTPVSSTVHNPKSSSSTVTASNNPTLALGSYPNTFSLASRSPGTTTLSTMNLSTATFQSNNSGSTSAMAASSLFSSTTSKTSSNPVVSTGSTMSTSKSLSSSKLSTIMSSISATTHDPCNDTLDCALLDKFWGVCRNITIASGCLSYCGFCPSGVPLKQATKLRSTGASQSTTGIFSSPALSSIPQSSQKQVSHMTATGSTSSVATVTTTVPPITSGFPSSTFKTSHSPKPSSSSQFSSMTVTLTNGMQGSTTPSCQDKPSVDCNVLNKFWNICADIKTAQPCLRSCGFCP